MLINDLLSNLPNVFNVLSCISACHSGTRLPPDVRVEHSSTLVLPCGTLIIPQGEVTEAREGTCHFKLRHVPSEKELRFPESRGQT